MKIPVIFLSFANAPDDHLPLLDEERKAIFQHLIPLESEQYIQLFCEPSATIKDLSTYISKFKERVHLFHYAGHAGGTKLLLTDQEAASDGIAQLLALQKKLKLVFLNGCSTREQVNRLFELGIPAVIATSVPISDPGAKDFSEVFYRSLADQHNIEDAFKHAAADFFMKKGQPVGIYRDLAEVSDSDDDDIPWGLYVNQGKEEVLSWTLPRSSAASFIMRGAQRKYEAGETLNKKLIITVANAIAPYSYFIKGMIEEAKSKGREPKMRDLRAAVIDSFPTPIGTHLRKLLLSEDINTERLQKIVNVYNVAIELLAYVMLAQLWDEKYKKPDLNIKPELRRPLELFFDLKSEELPTFSFIQLVKNLGEIFAQNKVTPFVKEFTELQEAFRKNEKFKTAFQFIEEMKEELEGVIAADEIESFCVQAEEHLSEIFSHLGFCAKYTLVTIKTIELMKSRHETPAYRHNLVILDKVTASFGVLDDVLISDSFSDSNSVVLLRDEESVNPFLNLSPFIIDENALSGQQNSKLFFFSYRDAPQFHFTLIDNLKDQLTINNDNYPKVKTQMESFARAIMEKKALA